MIESARFSTPDLLEVVIDGESFFVPDDMSNTQRRMVSEWERAGNVIAPYTPPPPAVPERVTSRQFMLQLAVSGLYDAVKTWVATQPRTTQLAFEYSGTFVRDDPAMQTGFAALGFTASQIDAFFTAASKI